MGIGQEARRKLLLEAAELMSNAAIFPFLVGVVSLSTWVLGLFFVIDMILAAAFGFEGSIEWMVESVGFVAIGTTFVLFALSTFIKEAILDPNGNASREVKGFLVFLGLGLLCIVFGIRDLMDSIL